jgi:hypothetical protein
MSSKNEGRFYVKQEAAEVFGLRRQNECSGSILILSIKHQKEGLTDTYLTWFAIHCLPVRFRTFQLITPFRLSINDSSIMSDTVLEKPQFDTIERYGGD